MVALARDTMEAPQPMSCLLENEVLRASRYSTWRWPIAITGALTPEPKNALAGIGEANEAYQRESRKGSREWVRHRRDLANHPVTLRLRWRAYQRRGGSSKAPPGGWMAWEKSSSRQRIALVTGRSRPSRTQAWRQSRARCCR